MNRNSYINNYVKPDSILVDQKWMIGRDYLRRRGYPYLCRIVTPPQMAGDYKTPLVFFCNAEVNYLTVCDSLEESEFRKMYKLVKRIDE